MWEIHENTPGSPPPPPLYPNMGIRRPLLSVERAGPQLRSVVTHIHLPSSIHHPLHHPVIQSPACQPILQAPVLQVANFQIGPTDFHPLGFEVQTSNPCSQPASLEASGSARIEDSSLSSGPTAGIIAYLASWPASLQPAAASQPAWKPQDLQESRILVFLVGPQPLY